MSVADVAVVGGGIIGCSIAAFLAEAGATVTLVEGSAVGAGASGRNSGAVQHPFDPVLAALHRETLEIYRDLALRSETFRFPSEPAGLLLLTDDGDAALRRAAELARDEPALDATVLDADALAVAEPILAGGLTAVRLATGFPIPPDAATGAMAQRARRAGADLIVGARARPAVRGDRSEGLRLADGTFRAADAVVVAAGPWTAQLIDPGGAWRPMAPTHGVTVQVALATPARHVLEEGVVHTVNRPVEAPPEAADEWRAPASLFSLVSVGPISTVGSTFVPVPPDPERTAPVLVGRGSRFVPALASAPILDARVCARPQSVDGRAFLGPVPGIAGLWVCAGHGPWGVSTGPASGRMLADAILEGAEGAIPPPLRVDRTFGW
ncbi:MAG TPA: FAD-binding oxidoreductase [Candidatus Limnocylindria bacterium]|nr:FAD-binding oxidoreductase [Candidatus Limnocylindria bacterium]